DGQLKDVAGVLIPGGFGDRGVEGKIKAARFARENKLPYLGLCLGMQVATIEFARNVCGIASANSAEFDQTSSDPVICLLDEQRAPVVLSVYPGCIGASGLGPSRSRINLRSRGDGSVRL